MLFASKFSASDTTPTEQTTVFSILVSSWSVAFFFFFFITEKQP
jgi:hypothetical protein